MDDYQKSPLWQAAFSLAEDGFDAQRLALAFAFADFRKRVAMLVAQIHKDMPSLTVHDITHLDALWWTASEIAGKNYPINPAEAFILGGAFLLHDAAHCVAAYPGGVNEIRSLPEWRQFSAIRGTDPDDLVQGSDQFQLVLFDVLRTLHPRQARRLAHVHWQVPGEAQQLYLLGNDDLRHAFGDAIGLVAESHWSSPHDLERLHHVRITPPACIHPAPWTVDMLKVAILLRTADAAHVDALRAPRFLFSLVQPGATSLVHWQFQSRIHEIKCDTSLNRNDLWMTGTAFPPAEQDAWWMAYDTARMIDNELRAADRILVDLGRPQLAARSVALCYSPEAFARNVRSDGWTPVDTSIKISDIQTMVERFGGEKLYGEDPASALRELLQNAVDAIHACRCLGGLGNEEGEIEVSLEQSEEGHWLAVQDTGIGMSRYVLTDVLLDFGSSLWRSPNLRGEWNNLLGSEFNAIGQFGIGFFSIFMLGERVRVVTRRYEAKEGENDQWLLEFTAGPHKRPVLREPKGTERLRRHGTRVAVLLSDEKLNKLTPSINSWSKNSAKISLDRVCAKLAPAIDINLYFRNNFLPKEVVVRANDWRVLPPLDLLKRILPGRLSAADPTKFGQWSHLSEVIDDCGNVMGRCAIAHHSASSLPPELGIGVVKGLYAGEVKGLAGIIFANAQADLARRTAVPSVSLRTIQRWAEEQKHLMLAHGELAPEESTLLAYFGATHEMLSVGKLEGLSVSLEEFQHLLTGIDTVFLHDGDVTHDDDDDVIRKEFESEFLPASHLLELPEIAEPRWLAKVDDEPELVDRKTWSINFSIDLALRTSWGNVAWDDDYAIVGHVHDVDIERYCKIATRSGSEENDGD